MPRYGISYEEVVQAAEVLLHQQKNPTIESVREQLGGTGSFATLSKHLNTWRQNRLLAFSQNNPVPIAPPDEVSKAVNHVWQQLNEKAQHEMVRLKEAQQAQLQALEAANQTLTEDNTQYQAQLKQLETEHSHLQADKALLQTELIEERKQKAILETELKGKLVTLETVIQEKDHALTTLVQQTEKRIVACESQRHEAQQSHQLERDQLLAYQEAQRQSASVEIDKLKVNQLQLEKTNTQLTLELKHSKTRLEALEEQLRGYEVDYKTLQHKYRQLLEEKNEAVGQVTQLETQLNQRGLQMEALTKQLAFMEHTVLQKLDTLTQPKNIAVPKKTKSQAPSAEADKVN